MLVSSLTQVFSSSTGNKHKLSSLLVKYFKFEVLKQLCKAYRVSQVQVLPFLMPVKAVRKKNISPILRGIYWFWLQYFFVYQIDRPETRLPFLLQDHWETSAHAQFCLLPSLCAQPVMHTSWLLWGAESLIISMWFKSAQAVTQTDELVICSHFKVIPWSPLLLFLWLRFLEWKGWELTESTEQAGNSQC